MDWYKRRCHCTEVRQLVGNAYSRAVVLLQEHRRELDELAGLLLKKEVVFKEDIEAILGMRK
ncbi:MAG TPA: hypothetical protein VL727_06330 [Puia sp.]|jgi:cell division protease FtsH|nr:hypothetical protein [Puia sp.]